MTLPVWSQTDFNTIFSPLTRLSDAFAPRPQIIPDLTVALHPGHVFNGIALVESGAYLTGDIATGSAVISNPSTLTGLRTGLQVEGLGIPQGTVITAIGGGTVTLSANATATLIANPLSAVQVTPAFTAPTTNPRIDRIVIDQRTGLLSVVAGSEAATPVAPAIPAGQVPVAQVRLAPGDTAITAAMITDERDAPRLGHGYRAADTESGASYSYLETDHYRVKLRGNAGAAMIDTLPGSSPGVMPAGWQVTIGNDDSAGILALTVGSGATLDGASGTIVYVGPGQRVTVVSDGVNYVTAETPGRCRLGAATSLYVAATGSDSNHGLTAAAPLATIQKAVDVLQDQIDLNGQDATVSVADGTYTAGVTIDNEFVGDGTVALLGNVSSPANCVISTTTHCIAVSRASVAVGGFRLTTASAGMGIRAHLGATVRVIQPVVFGAVVTYQIGVEFGADVIVSANYTIAGNADRHWYVERGGRIFATNLTITLTGTPAFASGFATAAMVSCIECQGNTFSGAATGMRYNVTTNSVINTNGASSTYLPGSVAGATQTGGQYN